MENYQMSRPGCRPYTRTCGMARPGEMSCRMSEPACAKRPWASDCSCKMPGTQSRDSEMYSHLQHMVPAMAYVPCQKMAKTFELPCALRVGTIFPELCKPFCGKRGGCR